MIGLGLGITTRAVLRGGGFSPAALFAAGEQGAWFDPDPTTTFTDTAGTTPAQVGQAVALMLDKSGNDHHATQPTAAARPILARVPSSGRRNLLTFSEDISTTSSNPTRLGFRAGSPTVTQVSDGFIIESTDAVRTGVGTFGDVVVPSGQRITCYIDVEYDNHPFVALRVTRVDGGGLTGDTVFNIQAGTVGVAPNTGSGNANAVASIIHLGSNQYRLVLSYDTTTRTQLGLGICASSAANSAAPSAGLRVKFLRAQFEETSTASAYQKVTSQFDVTEAGQPDNWYLSFDGVDDFMSTPSIDFTGTDKMSVFAGARKTANQSSSILFAHRGIAILDGGSFGMNLPAFSNLDTFFVRQAADTASARSSANEFPFSGVYTGLGDTAADPVSTLRINGVQRATGNAPTTGNFGDGTLSLGSRDGTTNFFPGHIHSLIVRGALTDEPTVDRTEKYVAGRTAGVDL